MSDGRRVPIAVVLSLAAVTALVLGDVGRARVATTREEGQVPAAALAPAGVRSAVWYCAFATSDAHPHSDDAAILTNLGRGSVTVAVSAMSGGRVTANRRVELAGNSTITLQAGDIGATADAGVLIEPFGSDVVVDHRASDAGGSESQTPCATRPSSDWYIPAGSTRRGSIERVALFNPFTQAAVVDVSAFEPNGTTRPSSLQALSVPPRSRTVIDVNRAADQRNSLAVAIHAERGTRLVAEVALEQRDPQGNGGFSIALGSPGLAREWHVATDVRAQATATVDVLNPGATDVSVSVQTIVAGFGRTSERSVKVGAGTLAVVGVPVPAGRPEVTVQVSSPTPSVAVAGFVTYQAQSTRRNRTVRPGPISIVTGATIDARHSAFATPGPGGSRKVTLLIENVSGAAASVDVSVTNAGHVKTTVGRDSLVALTLGVTAQSSPLVIDSNSPVYVYRRMDEGTGVSTAPALPAT